MEFAAKFITPKTGFDTPQQRTIALQDMYSMIQEAESVTTQDGYLSQVSRFIRVDEAALRRDYGQFKKRKRYPNNPNVLPEENDTEILTNVNFDVLFDVFITLRSRQCAEIVLFCCCVRESHPAVVAHRFDMGFSYIVKSMLELLFVISRFGFFFLCSMSYSFFYVQQSERLNV